MNRLRFSLASLLGFVTVAAVGFLALRNANELWSQLTFTSTMAVLLFATLAVVYRVNQARAFWMGFLVFGGTYMLLVYGPWLDRHVGQRLVTNTVLGWVRDALGRSEQPGSADQTPKRMSQGGMTLQEAVRIAVENGMIPRLGGRALQTPPRALGPSLQHVQGVGHPLFALLFALIGGLAGRSLYAGSKA